MLVPLVCMTACGGDPDAPASIVEEMRGDTIVVISHGTPEAVIIDSISVLWQSDELGTPNTMALVGDQLAIGDRDRVHVLSLTDGSVRAFGRSGDGPGEFNSVTMVGDFGGDTIGVFDARLRRVSMFLPDGTFLDSRVVQPEMPFVNASGGGRPLIRVGSGVLLAYMETVQFERPIRMGVIWRDLDADSVRTLAVLDDIQWTMFSGEVGGSRELFPVRAIVGIGRGGRIAEGNGRDYCIRIRSAFEDGVRMLCRERQPIRVGSAIRSPDFDILGSDLDPSRRAAWQEQDPGTWLPHFDEIRMGEDGELWVRILHEEFADVHPHIAALRPELQPDSREWEVFDADGRLLGSVRFSAAFRPRIIDGERVYGLLTIESGEIVIGMALIGSVGSG